MKNRNSDYIVWLLLIAGFVLIGLYGCRTKKSTTDFKETKTENVSVIDNSTIEKKKRFKKISLRGHPRNGQTKVFLKHG